MLKLTWMFCSLVGLTLTAHAATDEVEQHAVERGQEGWFWYKDPIQIKRPSPEASQAAPPAAEQPSVPKHPALIAHEALQRELNESMQIAVMAPTEENMKHFLAVWYEVRKKSSEFADIGRTVAWANPQFSRVLDGGRPTNPVAMRVHDQEKTNVAEQRVVALAKTHGIFFVFRSDCKYCHAFAPILRDFQEKYGFKVLPISLDGQGLPEYPDAKQDNGMVSRLIADMRLKPGEFRTPFTALVRPAQRELMPLGFGVMSGQELVERIDKVVEVRTSQAVKR
jgi:conjugal transfer pilus assembly protein TraF